MKIIKGDTIYVQVKDLQQLNESNVILSHSIIYSLYLKFNNYNDYDKDEFIAFNKEDAFFDDVEWIINYDDVINLSEKEIIELYNNTINERNNIADKFNSLSKKGRFRSRSMINKCKNLEYLNNSYKDLLDIKSGIKKITLPDGVEPLNENKLKKLIKSIGNRLS